MLRYTAAILIVLAVSARPAWGDVQEYEDFAQWQSAAGSFTTIGFDEIPVFSFVTTQYSDLGVTFVDGFYQTVGPSTSYPQDGFGLDGNGPIYLSFSTAITSIATHNPGTIQFDLYYQGQQVHTSGELGGGGVNFFAGLISDRPFDAAILHHWIGAGTQLHLDNLYFGPPIPAPGAAIALLCGLLVQSRQRRR